MASPVVRSPSGFVGTTSPHPASGEPKRVETDPALMPTLSERMCVTTTSPSAFVNEDYEQFQQTYGTYETSNSEKENDNNDASGDCSNDTTDNGSFWELCLSFYFPILLLWLRRGMFGAANLIRSLIVGHLLRLAFGHVSEWTNDSPWIRAIVQTPPSASGASKAVDPHAWPPPALTALAMLTVFTLVVHPDGYTWIVLGKLRATMVSLLKSLTQCWELVVNDYGVLPTIAASATLATLIFLVFVILRTLTPRKSKRAMPPPEKRKKKKKGQARHRGARIKSNALTKKSDPSSSSSVTSASSSSRRPLSPSMPSRTTASENAPELTPLTPGSASPTVDPAVSSLNDKDTKAMNDAEDELSTESISEIPLLPTSMFSEKDKLGRTRVPSVSTLDTTAMSDDQSCESTSIRSFPSVSVVSSKSNVMGVEQSLTVLNSKQKVPSASTAQRRSKRSGGKTKSKPQSPKVSEAPSRWDALKPDHNQHPQQHHHHYPAQYSHHHQNSHHHHHHIYDSHHHYGRSNNNRWGGKGGAGGGQRKGRNNYHNYNPSDSFFSVGSTNPSSASPKLDQSLTVSPVSPPGIVNQVALNRTSPVLTSLPPPPPGLGPACVGSGGARCSYNSFFLEPKIPDESSTLFPRVQQLPSQLSRSSWDIPNQNDTVPPPLSFNPIHQQPTEEWRASVNYLELSPARLQLSPVQQLTNTASDGNVSFGARAATGDLTPSAQLHATTLDQRFTSVPSVGSASYAPVVKENPFAPENNNEHSDWDSEIEAELKELGGRMAGSILDF